MMKSNVLQALFIATTLVLAMNSAQAVDTEFTVVIKDHLFSPAEINVPVGQKIKLVIDNQDDSAEEFESHALNREKVVAAKGKITIIVGPLKAGRYPFVGEYHEKTAKGVLVAQ